MRPRRQSILTNLYANLARLTSPRLTLYSSYQLPKTNAVLFSPAARQSPVATSFTAGGIDARALYLHGVCVCVCVCVCVSKVHRGLNKSEFESAFTAAGSKCRRKLFFLLKSSKRRFISLTL